MADRSISDLSGGQQQRVFLARALAQEPHIFLMDEPFTGVDATTQEATLALLDHLRQQEVTVLISTHDLNLAASRFDAVLLLNRRLIAFGEPNAVFTPENLLQAFGSQVLKLPDGMVLVDDCCPPDEEYDPEGKYKLNWLLQPLQYAFMVRGLLASVMVGILCAVMGTYVVLRGMAFLGDAMAHAILPGVAIAFLLHGSLLVGAIIAAVVIALSIGLFSKGGAVKEDTAIGILVRGGLVLGRGVDQFHPDLCCGFESHPVR